MDQIISLKWFPYKIVGLHEDICVLMYISSIHLIFFSPLTESRKTLLFLMQKENLFLWIININIGMIISSGLKGFWFGLFKEWF